MKLHQKVLTPKGSGTWVCSCVLPSWIYNLHRNRKYHIHNVVSSSLGNMCWNRLGQSAVCCSISCLYNWQIFFHHLFQTKKTVRSLKVFCSKMVPNKVKAFTSHWRFNSNAEKGNKAYCVYIWSYALIFLMPCVCTWILNQNNAIPNTVWTSKHVYQHGVLIPANQLHLHTTRVIFFSGHCVSTFPSLKQIHNWMSAKFIGVLSR